MRFIGIVLLSLHIHSVICQRRRSSDNDNIIFPGPTNAREVYIKSQLSRVVNNNLNGIVSEDDFFPENRREQIFGLNNQRIPQKVNSGGFTRQERGESQFSAGFNSDRRRQPLLQTFNSREILPQGRRELSSNEEFEREDENEPVFLASNTRTRNEPSSTVASNMRICEKKYGEYIQRIFPNDSDIASDANESEFDGRSLAVPGEYPHMTALGFVGDTGTVDYKCGGSLISDKFVITAAHCTNVGGEIPTKVRIGDLNLKVEETYLEPQIRTIINVYNHPEYRSTSYYNDIALLELQSEVVLTEFVRPIRLWTLPTFPFPVAYAMGYGSTAFAKERTNRLTHLNMTIVANDECNQELPHIPETEDGIIFSQMCAKDFALNRDTCQGDSGGPLQLNIRGRRRNNRLHYHLIGITSYGLFCRSGYPSIFTRVYSFLDWIERIVWKDEF
ncbi:venom protease [Musca autumnalis]|uniref:venom protease n=1 Tax=Musca autumnalis TaxID=221902 RepID=UPI003CFA6AD6